MEAADPEIDIYGETDDLHSVDENGTDGGTEDLYDAVLASGTVEGVEEADEVPVEHHHDTSESKAQNSTGQRKYLCYIGNMTWWTTDQDVTNAVLSVGVNDLVDVKFYENRANGQSKGFALLCFTSDQSVRLCMEKLSARELHGQRPVILPYSKQSLAQFESATKKLEPPAKSGGMRQPLGSGSPNPLGLDGRGGGPVFIGTIRIGTTPPIPMAPQRQPPMRVMSGMPPPQPRPLMATGIPPPGMSTMARPPVVIPPPSPNRPPPGFPQGINQMRSNPPSLGQLNGPPPSFAGPLPPGAPAPHINPNFYHNPATLVHHQGSAGLIPSGYPPQPHQQSMGEPLSEAEFEEIMNRNKTVSSSAISRAVSDAAAGEYASAIETLVTAISLIRQSKVAHDDRCKILISSLQDTLHGIEAKSYGSNAGSRGKDRSRDRSRSRDREASSRRKRRERTRSRSRSRERYREEYSPPGNRTTRHRY